MVFVPVPGCYQTTIFYSLSGQICMNTLTTFNEIADDTVVCASLNGAVMGWWTANLANHAPTTLTVQQVKTVSLDANDASWAILIPTSDNLGTHASPALPTNVTATCTFLTPLRGRAHRGRWYMVGLTEDSCLGNFLTGGWPSDLQAAFDALPAALTSVDALHVVAHRFVGSTPLSVGTYTFVNEYRMNNNVYTQRRRLRQGSA